MTMTHHLRLLLVGAPASELSAAAAIARAQGADVVAMATADEAIAQLRLTSAALVMIDVAGDVPGFMAQLAQERIRVPVLACGIDASAERAVAAIRAGARDYVPLPPNRELIAAALACAATRPPVILIGQDPATVRALAFGRAMAASRVPVLISGEPGTGKESVARAIHDASGRSGAFLSIECAGVAPEIVDSEMFGHDAGAFAGAGGRRAGKIDQAVAGTLFVRDVDCLGGSAQARLVSALAAATDIRLIATTTTDLGGRVVAGLFRADLLARLATAEVRLPPLRARGGDIGLLAAHLAERLAQAHDRPARRFGDPALAALGRYDWPGNIRELEDVVHRALVLAQGPVIAPEDMVLADGSRIVETAREDERGDLTVTGLVGRTVEDVERALILRTLERCRGNRTSASGILGISVRTMRNKLKSFVEAGIAVAPAA